MILYYQVSILTLENWIPIAHSSHNLSLSTFFFFCGGCPSFFSLSAFPEAAVTEIFEDLLILQVGGPTGGIRVQRKWNPLKRAEEEVPVVRTRLQILFSFIFSCVRLWHLKAVWSYCLDCIALQQTLFLISDNFLFLFLDIIAFRFYGESLCRIRIKAPIQRIWKKNNKHFWLSSMLHNWRSSAYRSCLIEEKWKTTTLTPFYFSLSISFSFHFTLFPSNSLSF